MSKASKKSAKDLLSATPAPQIKKEELKTQSSSAKQKKSGDNKRNKEGLQQEGLNLGLITRTSFAALPQKQRRLDSLALLLEGNGTCAAVCFDGNKILVSSNNAYMTQSGKESNTNTEKFMSVVMQYFQIVALQGKKDSSRKAQAGLGAQIEASITESLKALDNNLSSSKNNLDIRITVFKQICLMYLQGLKTEKPSNKTINTLAEEILPLSKLKKWNKHMRVPEFIARYHDEAPKILKAVPLSLDNTENQLAIGYFAEDEISNTSPGHSNYDEEEKIGHIDEDEQILSGDEKQQSSEQDNNGLSRCNAIVNGIC